MNAFDNRRCELGEGPLWHPERGQFFWFDILGQRLFSREGKRAREWRLDRIASAAGWIDAERLMVATETGLAVLDLETGALEDLAPVEAEDSGTRSNDGRADRQGGFWFGTMGKRAEARRGAIYRWHRGELRQLVPGMTIPNAICFSPDGRLAYYADTDEGKVWTQLLDDDGWPTGERRVFLDLAPEGLNPDGAVIDAEGGLNVALWGKGCVRRYDEGGKVTDEYGVPGRHSSCPAFGGADMRDLLVTTALEGIEAPDALQGLPYLLRARIPGLPEPRVVL